MSIWGKVIGGVAGFAMGGPLGAVLGGLAGHAVDRMRDGGQWEQIGHGGTGYGGGFGGGFGQAQRQAAFATAVIVLSAKMAKADGHVSRDEITAFRRIFVVPEHEVKAVGEIFNRAKADASGYEPYAQQIAMMFRHEPRVLEELLGALFMIAMADGVFHPKEEEYLRGVARIFGFGDAEFERLRSMFVDGTGGPAAGGANEPDPYQVLEVARDASDDDVKSAYRKLVRENHPDRLTAQGLPEEFIELANQKLATINNAYDRIKRERGLT